MIEATQEKYFTLAKTLALQCLLFNIICTGSLGRIEHTGNEIWPILPFPALDPPC